MISIQPYGDTALLVNFEQKIDRAIHAQVMQLYGRLSGSPGIRYLVPAYCSLTIVFDPAVLHAHTLEELVMRHSEHPGDAPSEFTGRLIEVPVCYAPETGPDLEEVSQLTGKSAEAIIEAHTGTEFYVYMLGFVPGFAYMGDMPRGYRCPRKATPRTRVPAGSVGLAGVQTGIYPFESPGGWQIIGRTPLPVFDVTREHPTLFRPGDHVRFTRIDHQTFLDLVASEQ